MHFHFRLYSQKPEEIIDHQRSSESESESSQDSSFNIMANTIIPVIGGQYRFKLIEGDHPPTLIGVFTHYSENENIFDIDIYVEAFTPTHEVPAKFGGLCGLPDLKRSDEHPQLRENATNIIILDRLYICKNSVFQERRVQWRLGMRNLYRISDDEADDQLSFIGFNGDRGSYINEEHSYLSFKMYLVEVRKSTVHLYCAFIL